MRRLLCWLGIHGRRNWNEKTWFGAFHAVNLRYCRRCGSVRIIEMKERKPLRGALAKAEHPSDA